MTLQQGSVYLARVTWMDMRREVSGHTTAVLLGVALKICSKQLATSLYSFHLAFSQSIWLEFNWCCHAVVLIQPVLFYQISDFRIVVNLSIVVHGLTIRMLISVDELLLPFQRLAIWWVARGTLIKAHELCFIWVYGKTNDSCCLLQVMKQRFSWSRWIINNVVSKNLHSEGVLSTLSKRGVLWV